MAHHLKHTVHNQFRNWTYWKFNSRHPHLAPYPLPRHIHILQFYISIHSDYKTETNEVGILNSLIVLKISWQKSNMSQKSVFYQWYKLDFWRIDLLYSYSIRQMFICPYLFIVFLYIKRRDEQNVRMMLSGNSTHNCGTQSFKS